MGLALWQSSGDEGAYWAGIFVLVALITAMAALGRLSYWLVSLGFVFLLVLINVHFPPIAKWGLVTPEGQRIIALIVSCNWLGIMGILKLYHDAYK
jgi:hypothetical protein